MSPDLSDEEEMPIDWPQTPDEAAKMVVIYQRLLAGVCEDNGMLLTREALIACADQARNEAAVLLCGGSSACN